MQRICLTTRGGESLIHHDDIVREKDAGGGVPGEKSEESFCSSHCTTDSRAWAGADARGSVWKSPSQEAGESVVAGGPEPEAYHGLETMNQDRYLRERGLKGHIYIQENRCGRTDIHVRFEVLADTAPWIASQAASARSDVGCVLKAVTDRVEDASSSWQ